MNEKYKELMLQLTQGKPLQAQHFMLSGALAGMTEAFVNCPFEVVKVRMQAKESQGLYKNTMDAALTTIRKEGITAIYKGLEPLLWRNGIWNGAYFGTIGSIKSLMPKGETKSKEQLYAFCAGVVGGTFATTLNTPFDVVKSRMQNTSVVGVAKWTLPTLIKIYREEGPAALFRGYVPRILRLGPGGGIMIVAFDFVNHIINSF
jgi:solute carrier family 25 2-oxodicarboxylate transporter 21